MSQMTPEELTPTRHTLLRRLKDLDDQASWQDFFDTYWRLIYGVAIKSGLTDQEAQEVVQGTVISVSRNIQKFKVGAEYGSFKGWLLRITRSRIVDVVRKRPPMRDAISLSDTDRTPLAERLADPASLELDAAWERNWRQNLLDAALEKIKAQLAPSAYQMFDLHVLKQWPANKVAKKLGVTMGRVYFAKYKVARLIKREVKRLEKKWI